MIGLATLAVAVLGVYFFIDKKDYSLRQVDKGQHENFQGQVSAANMALHNVPEDCWMEIHGSVYDLTEYAPDHPGGPEYVTDYCGMNATRFYDAEHSVALLSLITQYNLGLAVATTTTTTNEQSQSQSQGQGMAQSSQDQDEDEDESQDASYDLPSSTSTSTTTKATTAQPSTTQATSSGTAMTTTSTSTSTTPTVPQGCPVQYYSTETVAEHAVREDCWYILYGQVYDLTTYVDVHPGNARRIFTYCGIDATVPYAEEKKHDMALLEKKVPELLIGRWGSKTEIQYEPC